ncbi:MAG TPA: glycoside hydrolase family 15 protein [Gaiellaceae bacterium]
MTPEGLAARSVAVIREHQDPSGAFLAAPSPTQYRNSWLRDCAFVADALSQVGERTSAEAFFSWCAEIVEARAQRMAAREILDGRYTVDGREVPGPWSSAQLDGYGAWAWALGRHTRRHGVDPTPWLGAAELSLRYVADCWASPCFDWWEETWGVHTATLAALYGGLTAGVFEEPWTAEAADAIEAAVRRDGVGEGRLVAHLREGGLDASLVAVAATFGLFDAEDPVVAATVAAIEVELVHDGGVHRHPGDGYYGGGLWVLLGALLGCHYLRVGRLGEAHAQLDWVLGTASEDGDLPEQVDDHLLLPQARARWEERWGTPACPLLWSHAAFLTLAVELGVLSVENAA